MPATVRRAAAALVAVFAAGQPRALAHIGPSPQANNRYVKLTLLGDRVRLLYTVYLGDAPGQQTRRRIDLDRNGTIDADEQAAFGRELAATVARHLDARVDGQRTAVEFADVNVGIGTPSAAAGAFSVDLVAWLCLPPGRTHELVLWDHWRPPSPGESELRVEPSPGIDVTYSAFGAGERISQLQFRWLETRDPRPLDTLGFHLAFAVGDGAPRPDTACGAPAVQATGVRPRRRWWTIAVAIAAAGIAIAAAARAYRRRGYRNTNG